MGQHPGGSLGHDTLRFDYDGSGNLIYIGVAHPREVPSEAVWQIRKCTYDGSGNLVNVLYANGYKNFENVWDNRAALSYS